MTKGDEALSLSELEEMYRSFHETCNPEFTITNSVLYGKHRDGVKFNHFRFWEDMVLMAAEGLNETDGDL